jgi:predicted neutral ceramidase superfamily lipid hydrolase
MEQERGKKPSLLAVAATIVWSFLGIRRRVAHESETVQLSPVRILAAGVIGAVIFVVVLVALVKFIVASAG